MIDFINYPCYVDPKCKKKQIKGINEDAKNFKEHLCLK
jgi:hypothetical protein